MKKIKKDIPQDLFKMYCWDCQHQEDCKDCMVIDIIKSRNSKYKDSIEDDN